MKSSYLRSVLFVCVVCLLFVGGGCFVNFGGSPPKEKYERTVTLSEPLAGGKRFEAKVCNGAITVAGTDAGQCNITATLTTRGHTVAEAEELSGKIELRLEESGGGLAFRIDKPSSIKDNRIDVKLDVTIPVETDLVLETTNGNIDVRNIEGDLKAETVNGNAIGRGVFGKVNISTVNGQIKCSEISGDVRLSTVNGSVRAVYSDESKGASNIDISTVNGSINLEVPDGISAKVDASVLNGSINSSIPVTVKGKIGKRHLKGTVGSGQGRGLLRLRTVNGSVNIR